MKTTKVNVNLIYNSVYDIIKLWEYNTASNKILNKQYLT